MENSFVVKLVKNRRNLELCMQEPLTYILAFIVKVNYTSSILRSFAKKQSKFVEQQPKLAMWQNWVTSLGLCKNQVLSGATCGNKMTYHIRKIIPKWNKKAQFSGLFWLSIWEKKLIFILLHLWAFLSSACGNKWPSMWQFWSIWSNLARFSCYYFKLTVKNLSSFN